MLKQWRVAIILSALAMLTVLISACGASTGDTSTPTPTATKEPVKVACESGTLKTGGSTALGPLVQDAAKEYQKQCSGANITVALTGSGAGLKGASDGSLNVGNSDVFADATKYPGLNDNQVAAVVFGLIINDKVTGVESLTTQQVKDIYSGKTTNWKEVGGPDLAIVTVSRSATSGTRLTFEKYVLDGKETVSGANHVTASSSGDVATKVKQTNGAIAYDTTHFAEVQKLKLVKIDNVEATEANAVTNTYKFWNIEHMYTKGEATGLAKAFIEYVKGADGQSLRTKYGFVDITKLSADAVAAKTPKN